MSKTKHKTSARNTGPHDVDLGGVLTCILPEGGGPFSGSSGPPVFLFFLWECDNSESRERGCSKVSDSHTGEGLDTRAPETRLSPYSHGTEKQRNTNSESVLEVETDVHF